MRNSTDELRQMNEQRLALREQMLVNAERLVRIEEFLMTLQQLIQQLKDDVAALSAKFDTLAQNQVTEQDKTDLAQLHTDLQAIVNK
jgi:flagellar biosynthesis chaperone FliJ